MKLVVEVARVLAALLAAAAVAATMFAGFEITDTFGASQTEMDAAFGTLGFLWMVAFIVALAHAMVLGLPAFLVLRWRAWTQWWISPIFGFAIGCLPYAFFFSPLREQAASFSQVNDKVLVEDGVTTLAGWILYGEFVAGLGLLGIAGGIAAWLTWHGLGRATTKPASAAR